MIVVFSIGSLPVILQSYHVLNSPWRNFRLPFLIPCWRFNMDLLKSSDPILTSVANKLNLMQVVSSPTRTSPSSATLVDHIYISSGLNHTSCSILPLLHNSDHSSITSLCASLCLYRKDPTAISGNTSKPFWVRKELHSPHIMKLKTCYNILNNIFVIPSNTFTPHPHSSPCLPHPRMFYRPFARTQAHLSSFYNSHVECLTLFRCF